MSRKLSTLAILAGLALPIAAAHAQVGFGIAAGPSVPLGDFSNAVDAGYHVTGIVNVGVPLAPVGLRLEGSFADFNYKPIIGSSGSKARIYSGTANVVFSTPGIIGPYLIGGIGVYNASAVCTNCNSSDTKIGFNGGGGFKVGLAGFAVFAEARYHYVPGAANATTGGTNSSTQFIPVSVGVTF